jgi:4a-hydroxytetrahydrobiopterin dehydratase
MPNRLSANQVKQAIKAVPGWALQGDAIKRQYKFSDFLAAMVFVNYVAERAELMDHHPDILIEYNRVTLTLSTHSAKGLTDLDFKLAKDIDR